MAVQFEVVASHFLLIRSTTALVLMLHEKGLFEPRGRQGVLEIPWRKRQMYKIQRTVVLQRLLHVFRIAIVVACIGKKSIGIPSTLYKI